MARPLGGAVATPFWEDDVRCEGEGRCEDATVGVGVGVGVGGSMGGGVGKRMSQVAKPGSRVDGGVHCKGSGGPNSLSTSA